MFECCVNNNFSSYDLILFSFTSVGLLWNQFNYNTNVTLIAVEIARPRPSSPRRTSPKALTSTSCSSTRKPPSGAGICARPWCYLREKTWTSGSRSTVSVCSLSEQIPDRFMTVPLNPHPFISAVDFFNQINMLYGTITEFCTETSCSVMSAGPRYINIYIYKIYNNSNTAALQLQ